MQQLTVFTQAKDWLGLGRIFPHIKDKGFDITLIAGEGNILSRSSCVDQVISISPGAGDQQWIEAILSAAGSKLLVGDDVALDWLLRQSLTNKAIRNLVTRTLGDIDKVLVARGKLELSRCAEEVGVPVPEIIPLSSSIDTGILHSRLGWPLVFKSGYGFAGNEVFICRNLRESRKAQGLLKSHPRSFAQKYIPGRPIMVALACCEGRVLSQFSVLKRACWPPEIGPSTVVEVVKIPQVEEHVKMIVATLGLSGMISFDFVRDVQGECWLLECNVRPVPVSHFSEALVDAWLTGEVADQAFEEGRLFALFPQSILFPVEQKLRDAAILDIPSNDPGLLAAMEELLPELSC